MQLCKETDSHIQVLLYLSEVCGLSRAKVISRVFALCAEPSKFAQYHNHRHNFEESSFLLTLNLGGRHLRDRSSSESFRSIGNIIWVVLP